MRIALPRSISPAAFVDRDPAAAIATLDGATMGTTWSLRFACPRQVDPAAIRAAVTAKLDTIVAEMSHWEPGSLLSRFNRARPEHWTALPPDFAHVVAGALRIAAASDGAFDPAIGCLVNLWGFGPVAATIPPAEDALEAARRTSGWRRLAYDGAARRLRQPGGVALDLSGIAKGHAADAVADRLADLGVRHCLVEIGGELVGRGVRPDGDPWWVDLENPPGAELPPLRVALHDLAVATSGDYRRGAHTIDPRSGRPTMQGVASVATIARTALEADAWATALTVLGPAEGIALAERLDIAARIVSIDANGPREWITGALAAMLED